MIFFSPRGAPDAFGIYDSPFFASSPCHMILRFWMPRAKISHVTHSIADVIAMLHMDIEKTIIVASFLRMNAQGPIKTPGNNHCSFQGGHRKIPLTAKNTQNKTCERNAKSRTP